jgi:hypothetical protein
MVQCAVCCVLPRAIDGYGHRGQRKEEATRASTLLGEGEAREGEDEGQPLQLAPRQARRESTPRPCVSPVNSAAYQRNQGSSGACMPPLPPPLPLSESKAAVSTSTRRERGLVAGWLEENANLSVA